jgi:hypothetical protein
MNNNSKSFCCIYLLREQIDGSRPSTCKNVKFCSQNGNGMVVAHKNTKSKIQRANLLTIEAHYHHTD